MSIDLTVSETRKFEALPEDKWIIVRLIKRDVVRWMEAERKFATSADEIIVKLIDKLKSAVDENEQFAIRSELKGYQFSFTFKILEGKKYAGYVVKGRTGIWLSFTNTEGEDDPNKLAKLFLACGGQKAKKGEKISIDSILGGYLTVKVISNRNKMTRKVYQQVSDVREVSIDELAKAKMVEAEIDKIEQAIRDAEEKSLSNTENLTQKPILENQNPSGEIPF